jgi:xanthine dehydrogenase/oxidase
MAVNACLMPVLAADGCNVTTIEGIGTVKNDNLHPIQRAMVEFHGSQCGFCTPGIIVSLYALLTNCPTVENIEEHLDGNLCRCTGYRPIWDAARSLCQDGEECVRGPCRIPCRECPERDTCTLNCNLNDQQQNGEICCSTSADKMRKYKDTFLADRSWLNQANEMFPKELLDETSNITNELNKPLVVIDMTEFHTGGTWFKPNTLLDMLKLVHEFGQSGPGAFKIVVGNTEVGIESRFKHAVYPRLICPSESIRELFEIGATDVNIEIGSCCSLSIIQETFKGWETEQPRLSRTVKPIHEMLRWFGSTQIRNVACLGGNLVTASPISDLNPMLAALGSNLILTSLDEGGSVTRRSMKVSDFFLDYRVVNLGGTL